jgi:hypothetical protein
VASPDEIDEDRLWEQYGRVLDEYRFQVDLNWRRSQHFFVLCAAVLAAAGALLAASAPVPDLIIVLLFAGGGLIAILAIFATRTGHAYYQRTRDLKTLIEERLGLGDLAIKSTMGMGSRAAKLGKVTSFQTTMLVVLAAASVAGAIVTASDSSEDAPAAKVVVLPAAEVLHDGVATRATLIVLENGDGRTMRLVGSAGPRIRSLVPGRYSVSLLAPKLPVCETAVVVRDRPLQRLRLLCSLP